MNWLFAAPAKIASSWRPLWTSTISRLSFQRRSSRRYATWKSKDISKQMIKMSLGWSAGYVRILSSMKAWTALFRLIAMFAGQEYVWNAQNLMRATHARSGPLAMISTKNRKRNWRSSSAQNVRVVFKRKMDVIISHANVGLIYAGNAWRSSEQGRNVTITCPKMKEGSMGNDPQYPYFVMLVSEGLWLLLLIKVVSVHTNISGNESSLLLRWAGMILINSSAS